MTDSWQDLSDNWSTSADWSNGVPTSTSDVLIARGDPLLDASTTIHRLTLGNNTAPGGLTISGSSTVLTVSNGFTSTSVSPKNLLELKSGAEMDVSDGFTNYEGVYLNNNSTVKVNGTGGFNFGLIDLNNTSGQGGELFSANSFTNYNDMLVGSLGGRLSSTAEINVPNFDNEGTVQLFGSAGVHAKLSVGTALTNNGSIHFNSDTDTIASDVTGTGSLDLSKSTLTLGGDVSSGQQVIFANGVGQGVSHLDLNDSVDFAGTVETFFTSGDTVTAHDFAYASTTVSYTQDGSQACHWTLTSGGSSATIHFGHEACVRSDFTICSSAGGSVQIKYT
jgi:hypothetical protein